MLRKLLWLLLAFYIWKRFFSQTNQRPSSSPQQPSSSNINQHYRTLEVEPHASVEDIKNRHRQLCRQFHPDTLANASQELQDQAASHMAKINAAYAEIKKHRGFH